MNSTLTKPTSVEKVQQYKELFQRVHQLETTLLQRHATEVQTLSKEPKISLPAKFDGTRSQFRGFLNQVRLVIKLHPSCYPTDVARVGLVGTLLMGTVLPWFAPLLEKHSPLIEDFDEFIKEFQGNFGVTDSMRTTKGDRPTFAYSADFRLLAWTNYVKVFVTM